MLEVERNALLVAMGVLVVGKLRRTARLVIGRLARLFDLDDGRPPVGELAHGGRTGAHAREVEYGESGKRTMPHSCLQFCLFARPSTDGMLDILYSGFARIKPGVNP
ncbi:hypothetical protein D3C72_1798340 [compost metagenome]